MSIGFASFLAQWLVMMAAMMAPSVYPTVRLFVVAQESRVAFGVQPGGRRPRVRNLWDDNPLGSCDA